MDNSPVPLSSCSCVVVDKGALASVSAVWRFVPGTRLMLRFIRSLKQSTCGIRPSRFFSGGELGVCGHFQYRSDSTGCYQRIVHMPR